MVVYIRKCAIPSGRITCAETKLLCPFKIVVRLENYYSPFQNVSSHTFFNVHFLTNLNISTYLISLIYNYCPPNVSSNEITINQIVYFSSIVYFLFSPSSHTHRHSSDAPYVVCFLNVTSMLDWAW